jgi:hypothetical protein
MFITKSRTAADVEQMWMRCAENGLFIFFELQANGFADVRILCLKEDYDLVQSNYELTQQHNSSLSIIRLFFPSVYRPLNTQKF